MALEKISLFLVDDEADIVSSVSEALCLDYNVHGFESAISALETIDEGSRPDIIVTDLRMPEVDGFDFIKAIRERNIEASIIVASGHADKSDVLKALSFGVSAFLEKPFTIKQIKYVIDEAVRNQTSIRSGKTEKSDLQTLNEELEKLCEVYFARATVAENQIMEKNDSFYSNYAQVNKFLSSVRTSRVLSKNISEIKKKLYLKVA